MNTEYRKKLPGTDLDYFDTRQAVEDIQAGAYENFRTPPRSLRNNSFAAATLRC